MSTLDNLPDLKFIVLNPDGETEEIGLRELVKMGLDAWGLILKEVRQ